MVRRLRNIIKTKVWTQYDTWWPFLNQTVILFFFPIGQLHVDDYERRKSNAKCFLAEETGFIILASGNFSPISKISHKK